MKPSYDYEDPDEVEKSSLLISDINPNALNVLIELDFAGNFRYPYKNYSRELKPIDKAFFAPDCVNKNCTKGYYKLYDVIKYALRTCSKNEAGQIRCNGWFDDKKTKFCHSLLNYKITIVYKKQSKN